PGGTQRASRDSCRKKRSRQGGDGPLSHVHSSSLLRKDCQEVVPRSCQTEIGHSPIHTKEPGRRRFVKTFQARTRRPDGLGEASPARQPGDRATRSETDSPTNVKAGGQRQRIPAIGSTGQRESPVRGGGRHAPD